MLYCCEGISWTDLYLNKKDITYELIPTSNTINNCLISVSIIYAQFNILEKMFVLIYKYNVLIMIN